MCNPFYKSTVVLGTLLGTLLLASTATAQPWRWGNQGSKIKNVIVMIPDGCDETVQTVARWFKGEPLQVDQMDSAAVKQHMADSVITDSAAAASAFAGGWKVSNGFLGVGPRSDTLLSIYAPEDMAEPYAPFASVLEAAKLKGKATGIAVTSRVTHATPAAYYAHNHSRNDTNNIMEQLVYSNVDVVFGGGKRHLLPNSSCDNAVDGGYRDDCENLLDVLTDRGYQFVDNRDDMLDLHHGKAWGLFAYSHMQPDMDRQHFAPTEPALSEMVAKAIDLLKRDKDGFFLMVEGSQVDWAGHNNDPIYMTKDFIAFDDAVKVAVDFAKADGHTLVMAFPDHNTGGMKIGHYYTPMGYTETTVEDLVAPLQGMTMTANGVVSMMNRDYSVESIIANVGLYWGLDITEEDAAEIIGYAEEVGMSYSLARVLSERYTVLGWTTHGHNGETVPVWVYGQDAPKGVIDNTDLATIAADAMYADLGLTTDTLYVDVDEITDDYTIDTADPANPVLVIAGAARFPINKDYMVYEGVTYPLPGLTVYASVTEKAYISIQAWWGLWSLGLI